MAIFNRDTNTGALTYSTKISDGDALTGGGNVDGLGGANSVAVSTDGKNVYVTGENDNALAVFNRNTSTGVLTFSTVFKDGTDGVDGLATPKSVTVSEDGKNVYVASDGDDALAVFTRNTSTGALTFSPVFKDGSGGVDGLNAAWSVAVSQDGKNVYVVGRYAAALAIFNRDTNTGALTYSTKISDGDALTGGGNVDGLGGATSVAVSENGKHVYVAGFSDNALAVFNRDTTTGVLTYSTVFTSHTNGVDGLNGAYSVAASQDGKNVYVVSLGDSALVVFTWE
ncbi:MAG: hypothetical protein B0D92_04945 [Spirochaeta sp. LUC14_002_19_P3]|nr:MAG: hypothetical protein B0D92_04945 [Spirochaeta sp. LUC14_002_19_P3]